MPRWVSSVLTRTMHEGVDHGVKTEPIQVSFVVIGGFQWIEVCGDGFGCEIERGIGSCSHRCRAAGKRPSRELRLRR